MKFYEHPTMPDTAAKLGIPRSEWTQESVLMLAQQGPKMIRTASQLRDELNCIEAKRPYYSVWPAIVEPLRKTKLTIPGKALKLPRSPILIRFAEGKEPTYKEQKLCSILASEVLVTEDKESKLLYEQSPDPEKYYENQGDFDATSLNLKLGPQDQRGLCLWCNLGQTEQTKLPTGNKTFDKLGFPVMAFRVFPLEETTIEESLIRTRKPEDPITDTEEGILTDAVRIVVAVCLLGEDSDFFEPDVLSKDMLEYVRSKRIELVHRAQRRGKIGWHVGRQIDKAPSIVAPYFAIRWMGHGPDKKPILRPVSGYVAKRAKITQVPTGYFDDEETPKQKSTS